jgi:two-component system, cell cycle sensor histidine kinase and response regulator CckA
MYNSNLDRQESISGEMYRRIVEAVPEGIWVVDPQGKTVFSNRRMAEILGVDFESMPEQSCFACVFPEDLADAQHNFARGMAGDRRPFDFRIRRADGSPLWVSISCMTVADEAGGTAGLLGLFSDISERRRAEDALRQSEERLRHLVDAAPVMTWMSGPDRKATFYNARALAFAGVPMEELVGDEYVRLLHPEDRERYLEIAYGATDARTPFSTEVRYRRADGEYRWLLVSGVPRFVEGAFLGHIGTGVDITDLKRSYEEHLASQHLESLGVLAAGVAHDFNNLLGAILIRAESAQSVLEAGSSAAEDIDQIRVTALRATEIVSQLMLFAGQENAPSAAVDVSGLVAEMVNLLKVSVTKTAAFKTELAGDLPPIHANPAEIRRVIMNLVINASESLESKAGSITISTSRGSVGPGPSPAVCLEVKDTGSGMTADVKARIFEPFFSTRFAGRGLGLFGVQSIVRRLGGSIEVASTPGEGSSFTILLPLGAEAGLSVPTETGPSNSAAKLAATVLLVEDEEAMRSGVAKALLRRNFRVLEALDGATAVEILKTDPAGINLVLLDVTLPGMSSREVFDELSRIRPDLKVILSSAYSWERVNSEFGDRNASGFIRKPYRTSDLVELLIETLNENT